MKIAIGKEKLIEGLQRVFSIVPQKPTLPVLSNFLLKTSDNRLLISGTDMDISITTSVECTISEEGSITVNAKRFIGIIRELSPGEIIIFSDGEKVTVTFSSGHSIIMGMPASDFPALKETLEGVEIGLSGPDLVEMVDKTAFSVSQDRTRLSLTGILWNIKPDSMTMVSTDGHRLSLFTRNVEIETPAGSEAIVPPKSLHQAAQIITSGSEMKRVIFGNGSILFDFDTTKIFTKLIEGPYPNFDQVIPKDNSKHVFAATGELAAAVRRVSVLSNSLTHQVRILVTPGQLELTTRNDDIGGESRESIPVRYDGDSLEAAYNAMFLSEILKRIETEEVKMELENDEYTYLIMPLRLSE